MAEYRRRIPGLNSDQVMHAMGIDDAYHVERVLVRGRNGVTELVTIEGAGPFVRKKMPLEDVNRSVWAALAGGDCPRLPQVAATYEMPDCFVAVYDYVPGETLEEVVARAGALDSEVALQVARDVCEALAVLHARGVMHLDVSPRNVILAADGAHLVDFGNARLIVGNPSATDVSRPKGTWGFAAPEQFFSRASARSDVFAVGRLMGYMLTGAMPDEDAIAEFEAALCDESRVLGPLRHLIGRATDFEPSARYQNMDELLGALDAVVVRDGSAADFVDASESAFDGSCDAASPSAASRPGVKGAVVPGSVGRRPFSAIGIAIVALACVSALMGLVIAYRVLLQDRPGGTSLSAEDLAEGDPDDGAFTPDDFDTPPLDVPTAGDLERAFESLKIVESGWTGAEDGYIGYAVTLENVSDDLIIEYPEVVITGRDAAGSVVFSSSQVMSVIFPNSTMTFSCTAGDGTAPEAVEFSLARPRDYQVSVGAGEPTGYKVHNVTSRRDSYGTLTVSGEIEKVSEGDEPSLGGDIWLSVVLRDDEGNIISGANSFVGSPSVGKRMPFSMQIYDCPQYETLEIVPLCH